VFHPVGQSELKKWLTDLGARDGVPAISRATPRATAANGSNELDEQDVVLLDTDADVVDGQEPTSLAVVNGGGGGSLTSRPRVSRSRVTTPDLPVPEDAETMSDRAGPGELSLPVPDDDRPGDRRRRRGGSGISILFIGALLVAGAWFGGKYARMFLHMGGSEPLPPAGASTGATAPAAPAADQPSPREITRPGESARAREAAKAKEAEKQAAAAAEAAEAAKPAEAADAPTRAAGEDTPSPARHGSDTAPAPAREPSPRRRPGDKSIDFVGRDIANLKDKMAPDPSLLPPAPPAEAPPVAPAPTPAPASPDNP
jgi:hypothetical protein